MNFFEAIVIAIVEGLTEFLPVSSTAHMIFTSSFFGIQEDAFVKMFMVSIQLGSILSVVVMYWRKFFDKNNLGLYVKLACAVLPALILGKLFDDKIEAILGSPRPIAVMLIIGGWYCCLWTNGLPSLWCFLKKKSLYAKRWRLVFGNVWR